MTAKSHARTKKKGAPHDASRTAFVVDDRRRQTADEQQHGRRKEKKGEKKIIGISGKVARTAQRIDLPKGHRPKRKTRQLPCHVARGTNAQVPLPPFLFWLLPDNVEAHTPPCFLFFCAEALMKDEKERPKKKAPLAPFHYQTGTICGSRTNPRHASHNKTSSILVQNDSYSYRCHGRMTVMRSRDWRYWLGPRPGKQATRSRIDVSGKRGRS
ncbi:hypothetical protein V8F33_000874 [Rhypophila sp. PSN 637]